MSNLFFIPGVPIEVPGDIWALCMHRAIKE